ncbi:MAG: TRAP transporter small permease subunit [Clostridiales Family XIII bacterium]|jgi:TRAP-type C4-dicarboxylate transport system permease small subunit|nr:TRAP transporter small permease subunit [Clostridiales Family XIII bacterium]
MLFARVVRATVKCFMYISVAATVVMLCITVADVVLRTIFRAPVVGVIEISQVLLVSIMASMAAVIIEHRNIEVRLLVDAVPKKAALGMDISTITLSIAYFAMVGWQTLESIRFSLQFHVVYALLRIPEWPFLALLGVSFVVAAFAAAVFLIERVRKRDTAAAAGHGGAGGGPELAILSLSDGGDGNES